MLVIYSGSSECLSKPSQPTEIHKTFSLLFSLPCWVLPEKGMAASIAALVLLLGNFYFNFKTINGFTASGWSPAHATFYGGSDASGTMGTSPKIPSLDILPEHGLYTHNFPGHFESNFDILNGSLQGELVATGTCTRRATGQGRRH